MIVVLFASFVQCTNIDPKCVNGKSTCLQPEVSYYNGNTNSYTNHLSGISYPVQVDKKCDNARCFAYLFNKNAGNDECRESCFQKKGNNDELIKFIKSMKKDVDRQNKSIPAIIKTITVNKETKTTQDPITFFKTEVKTVTVDVEKKNDSEECSTDCLKERKKSRRRKSNKKPFKRSITQDLQIESDCGSECRDNRTENSLEEGIRTPFKQRSEWKSEDVTVTKVIEKTKTIEKPMTLFREMVSTVTVEKPIINYKVTTFTQISTRLESITVTRTVGRESNGKNDNEPISSLNSEYPTNSMSFSYRPTTNRPIGLSLTYAQPRTVTVYTNSPETEQSTLPAITVTKQSTLPAVTITKAPETASPVTISNIETAFSSVVSECTVTKTITKEIKASSMPVSILAFKTETSKASRIATVTKTVTEEPAIESPKKSIEVTKTVTRTVIDRPITTEDKTTSIKQNRSRYISSFVPDPIPTKTNNRKDPCEECEEMMSTMIIPSKYPRKVDTKKRSTEATKAIAKGCEITSDTKRKSPRTVCRFIRLPPKTPEPTKRKKRTVVKTVFAEESDEIENITTKTVFA